MTVRPLSKMGSWRSVHAMIVGLLCEEETRVEPNTSISDGAHTLPRLIHAPPLSSVSLPLSE